MKSSKPKAMKVQPKAMKTTKATKAMKSTKSAKADQKELDNKIESFLKEAAAVQASSSGDVDLRATLNLLMT